MSFFTTGMSKKTLLSGIQPSGKLNIGNYFGAIKQFIDMQDSHNAIYMIVDYHALNTIQDKKVMSENILNLAIDYLALGLDPKKSIIFKQSDVSEHTELCWIFDTITTMPFLMRAHAYKDAEANNKEISVGKFNYPMLMAADILLYDTDIVPVGQDQRQHIPLFATDEEIEKAVMGIVTDSSGDVPQNVYAIHRLLKSEAELKDLYENSKGKYKVLKEALIIDMKAFVKPLREKREQLAKDIDYVLDILKEGGKRAKIKAEKKMEQVKSAIGVDLY